MSHSFTLKATPGGVLRTLITKCGIAQGFDPVDGEVPTELVEFVAIWDTGATASVITQKVVDACGLQPTGMIMVHGVNSTEQSETYLVSIMLPNNTGFSQVNVTKGRLSGDVDVLIGMDIITQGDFSITNKDGNTVFSFRVPSEIHTDFVKETNDRKLKVKFQHGGSKKNRANKPKNYGKNKRK